MIGREQIGEFNPEMLLIDTKHSADVCHITIASGQGKLKRGTVLAVNADNKCCILGTPGCKAYYILAADTEDTSAQDVVAVAYRSGDFNKNALITAERYEWKEADIAMLRDGGIYLGNVM